MNLIQLKCPGAFIVLFLVRGHTHNRLDGANKEVSAAYFSAPKVTSLKEMVKLSSSPF